MKPTQPGNDFLAEHLNKNKNKNKISTNISNMNKTITEKMNTITEKVNFTLKTVFSDIFSSKPNKKDKKIKTLNIRVETLKRDLEIFESIADMHPNPISMRDIDGNYIYANKAFLRIAEIDSIENLNSL
jgi:PAS domain-containing protein